MHENGQQSRKFQPETEVSYTENLHSWTRKHNQKQTNISKRLSRTEKCHDQPRVLSRTLLDLESFTIWIQKEKFLCVSWYFLWIQVGLITDRPNFQQIFFNFSQIMSLLTLVPQNPLFPLKTLLLLNVYSLPICCPSPLAKIRHHHYLSHLPSFLLSIFPSPFSLTDSSPSVFPYNHQHFAPLPFSSLLPLSVIPTPPLLPDILCLSPSPLLSSLLSLFYIITNTSLTLPAFLLPFPIAPTSSLPLLLFPLTILVCDSSLLGSTVATVTDRSNSNDN